MNYLPCLSSTSHVCSLNLKDLYVIQLTSIICRLSNTEAPQIPWVPGSLKESMEKYSGINVKSSENLLHILLLIYEQLKAKLEHLSRALTHCMHVTTYPEYSMNDSESLYTPLTIPAPSLNCRNMFSASPCKEFAIYILMKSKTIQGVLLHFTKQSTRKMSAKATIPQNPNSLSSPS